MKIVVLPCRLAAPPRRGTPTTAVASAATMGRRSPCRQAPKPPMSTILRTPRTVAQRFVVRAGGPGGVGGMQVGNGQRYIRTQSMPTDGGPFSFKPSLVLVYCLGSRTRRNKYAHRMRHMTVLNRKKNFFFFYIKHKQC